MPKDNTLEKFPGFADKEARLKRVKKMLKKLNAWPVEDVLELSEQLALLQVPQELTPLTDPAPAPDVQPPA